MFFESLAHAQQLVEDGALQSTAAGVAEPGPGAVPRLEAAVPAGEVVDVAATHDGPLASVEARHFGILDRPLRVTAKPEKVNC